MNRCTFRSENKYDMMAANPSIILKRWKIVFRITENNIASSASF